jgi:uncharacterized protein YecE (DUF72 family)
MNGLKEMVRTGCISWTYEGWLSNFYPEGTKSADYLPLYSKAFDLVEIDSSFYRIPNPATIKQWREKTPDNFLFTAKLPRKMSHDAKLKNISSNFEYFQKVIKGLGSKLACVVVQLPPSFKFDAGIDDFVQFLGQIDPSIRYAVEFRNKSWLNEEAFDLLRKNKICFVWSVNEYTQEAVEPELTTDFVYLRFMGQYDEFTEFDRPQADKTPLIEEWGQNLQRSLEKISHAYVLMSNHFEGFAPVSANRFRKAMGLEEIDWKAKMTSSDYMRLT